MLSRLIFITISISGCTASFSEPYRTRFYDSCRSYNLSISTCECIEREAISATGITNVVTLEDEVELSKKVPAEVLSSCTENNQ